MKTRFNGFTSAMVLALGLLLGFAPYAQALPTLNFAVDGVFAASCADGAACDLSGPVPDGVVVFSGSLGGVYGINISTGITKPVPGYEGSRMDLNSVNVQTLAAGNHTLELSFSETGYLTTGLGFDGDFGGTVNGSVTARAYFDDAGVGANALFCGGVSPNSVVTTCNANGTLIGSTGPLGPGPFAASFSGPGPTNSPYSLTQVLSISTGGIGATFSGDFELNQVPEPTSVALFGGVLLLTGAAIRRKAAKKA